MDRVELEDRGGHNGKWSILRALRGGAQHPVRQGLQRRPQVRRFHSAAHHERRRPLWSQVYIDYILFFIIITELRLPPLSLSLPHWAFVVLSHFHNSWPYSVFVQHLSWGKWVVVGGPNSYIKTLYFRLKLKLRINGGCNFEMGEDGFGTWEHVSMLA